MRLRQLSRKLEIKTDKILEFLSKAGHTLENDANGKLTAEQVVLVEAEFPTPFTEETIEAEPIVKEKEQPEKIDLSIDEVKDKPLLVKDDSIEIETPLAPPDDVTNQVSDKIKKQIEEAVDSPKKETRLFKAVEAPKDDPNIELIKAPVVKLDGLKVIGKIDLPTPKEKPKKEEEEQEKETTPRRKVKPSLKNRNSVRHQDENPVERERKRQEKIAARRKRDAEQKLKEKKAENYRKKLKSIAVPPAKGKKKKKATIKTVEITTAPIIGQNKPKTTATKPKHNKLRRFWGWLNGEYDRY